MASSATSKTIDFTGVKEGTQRFKKIRQPQGDYKGKIIKVIDSPTKNDNTDQWEYTIQVGPGTYPYRCKLVANQYWKIRNLFVAAGVKVPQKKVKVDPNLVVGRFVGVTLVDDEYNERKISEIDSVLPLSELNGGSPSADDDDDEDEDEDEEVEAPPVKSKKKAQVVEEEEDEDEDEDEDEEEPPKPSPSERKAARAKARKAAAAKAAAAAAAADDDDDDELDEIDIDDV